MTIARRASSAPAAARPVPVPLLVAVALVATACLAPGAPDPTGGAPVGALELVADAGGGIRVAGWALDPETAAPVMVKVGVRGVVQEVLAADDRPDVGAAYPGNGPAHGFDHVYGPLAPGAYDICVWVDNQFGRGDARLLGCRYSVQVGSGDPVGSLERIDSAAPRTITVAGWAFDPGTTAPAEVVITNDGRFALQVDADLPRGDVAATWGRPATGFSVDFPADPGRHQICVGVFNVGFGADRLLGCGDVVVAELSGDRRPTGALGSVRPVGPGEVAVEGTASDPDGTDGLAVRLEVDEGRPGARSVVVPVVDGAFATTLAGLAEGPHSVCPTVLDVPGVAGDADDLALPCGSVVLGALAVGTAGATSAPIAVAPPAGAVLEGAERDAGVSVTLRDGSVMWFFGDTSERDRVGNLLYFVNNTAAWAPAGSPTVTQDGADGTRPWQFVEPVGDWCAGHAFDRMAMWPEAAVALPQPDGTDRVVVFMSKVCLGTAFLDIEARGMAVVETTYDPASPPAGLRIAGTITENDLADAARPWGRGAVVVPGTGHVVAYECGVFGDAESCHAARVLPEGITDRSQWRYWNGGDWALGSSWVPDEADQPRSTCPRCPAPPPIRCPRSPSPSTTCTART